MVTQGVCVFWQSLPWLRRDIDGIHACGLFSRARTLTSKIPDRCIGRYTLDAFARLTPEEFGRFRERVALDGPKKGRTRLKQVFKQALKAAPQVWLPFLHQCFFILVHLLSEQSCWWMLLRAKANFLGLGPLRCGKSPDHWRRKTRMRSKRSMDRMALWRWRSLAIG